MTEVTLKVFKIDMSVPDTSDPASLRRSMRIKRKSELLSGLPDESIQSNASSNDSSQEWVHVDHSLGMELPLRKRKVRSKSDRPIVKYLEDTKAVKTPPGPATTVQANLQLRDDVHRQALGVTSNNQQRSISNSATVSQSQTAASNVNGPLRPQPYGIPPVWADDRQALCETVGDYYKSYQSGPYHKNGYVYGFYLGRDDSERMYMDEEIVITRAGGGRAKNANGVLVQQTDHNADQASIKGLYNNMKTGVPLVLIAGKENLQCPSQLIHEFNVMTYFQVTDIWAEKNDRGKVIFKFRFEKLDLGSKSWWAAKDSAHLKTSTVPLVRAVRQDCNLCETNSPQVFSQGWMCLNEKCTSFWLMTGTSLVSLTYNPAFIHERTASPHIRPTFELVPTLPSSLGGYDMIFPVSHRSLKGIVCPDCHKCTSRQHWSSWACTGCGFVSQLNHNTLAPFMVRDLMFPLTTGFALDYNVTTLSEDQCKSWYHGDWYIHRYELIEGNYVLHFQGNQTTNSQCGGANELFQSIQEKVTPYFQRYPMKAAFGKGTTLANHFAHNFGEPYKYIIRIESTPFSDAPAAILSARDLLSWAAQISVEDGSFREFNELLAVGYVEGESMGYHDDGETGLGPTVATFSLGGNASMKFRMKDRYYKGHSKTGQVYPNDPVLPGCFMEKDRHDLLQQKETLSAYDYSVLLSELITQHKSKKASEILHLELAHGDFVVMHGADMQRYFEHGISFTGLLRFALTARYIETANQI